MQANKKNVSRRNFIRNTSLVAGGFIIVPRHVLGRGFIAPSDKLNIAAIGVGGKADVNIHLPGIKAQKISLRFVMLTIGWQ